LTATGDFGEGSGGDGDPQVSGESDPSNEVSSSLPVEATATESAELPEGLALLQNYPNPFSQNTTIEFTLAEPDVARITVFDLLGRMVAELANGRFGAGTHRLVWGASSAANILDSGSRGRSRRRLPVAG